MTSSNRSVCTTQPLSLTQDATSLNALHIDTSQISRYTLHPTNSSSKLLYRFIVVVVVVVVVVGAAAAAIYLLLLEDYLPCLKPSRMVCSRDGNGSSFVTHDPCDPSHSWPMTHMTHDPWSLPLRMGQGGAWHGGTGQPSRSSEQKNRMSKLSPQLW